MSKCQLNQKISLEDTAIEVSFNLALWIVFSNLASNISKTSGVELFVSITKSLYFGLWQEETFCFTLDSE